MGPILPLVLALSSVASSSFLSSIITGRYVSRDDSSSNLTTCTGTSASQGRKIGYWQTNSQKRACATASLQDYKSNPMLLNGYTHLNYAFADIDPDSFEIADLKSESDSFTTFTSLGSSTLEPWIAVGGGQFSQESDTQTTWSDMAGRASNRAAFINSTVAFMKKYGFKGVDLDWEYPVAVGGKDSDTANFVTLVREMRAAFGTTYGISVALPASEYYLQYFNVSGMDPYVDWFGFMAYDIHGAFASETKTVKAQTDIRDIASSLATIVQSGIDFHKLNLGLAYYGRGYALSNYSCNTLGCPWTNGSRADTCTDSEGLMSLYEIEDMISERKIQPTYISEALIKSITFGYKGNQWMGYDDSETFTYKAKWADQHCFGGTLYWSIDLRGNRTGYDWT